MFQKEEEEEVDGEDEAGDGFLKISNETEMYVFSAKSLKYMYFDFDKHMLVRTRDRQHTVPGLVYGIKKERTKKRRLNSSIVMNLLLY